MLQMSKPNERAPRNAHNDQNDEYSPKEPGRLSKLLFRSYYQAGAGEDLELPKGGSKLFFYLVFTYPWKLILLNLLTLLLCVPIVTIPATLSALSRVSMKLAMQGYCNVFAEYWEEWKAAWVRYLPFFFLSAIPAIAGIVVVWSRIGSIASAADFLLVAVCALVFFIVYVLWCYAFPLFAIIDLPPKQNIRNAFFFLASQPRINAILIALPLGITAILLLFWPWTAIWFALCHFSLMSLLICCIVKPAICEHAIKSESQEG